jgi:hypothetical protein
MDDLQTEKAARKRRRKLIESIRIPHVSGKASAAGLVACFALTAVLIPMAVRLPLWVDFEIVLAAWWVVWAAALGWLFYHGQPVADDHRLGEPRWWFGSLFQRSGRRYDSDSLWWLGVGEPEGCALVIAVFVGIVVLAGAVWLVVEVAVPVVAFLLYFLVRGMLARALNTDHGCQGRVLSAVSRGLLWATVYTAPLAGLVWLIHRVHGRSG